jgi:3-methyladenine DNA glycosylase AlkD
MDIVTLYLGNTSSINNWDLVDISACRILGEYLLDKERVMLESLATSACLWERRIAIIATFAFIRSYQFTDTLKLSTMLLNDREDLIQKAVGWMLREVGNRDRATELGFLDEHASSMPRTMLRYAVEKLPADRRRAYLDAEYSGERVIRNASSRCE